MMKKLVIIPTYNELENMKLLIPQLMKLQNSFDVLVVDDGSPDGTAAYISDLSKSNQRLHLLNRTKKEGLGRAYVAGFKWALSNGYETITQMDADFSHRPVDLDQILTLIPQYDLIIGSRYVPGGKVVNWNLLRKFISRGGSLYSRIILGYPTNDWTGGFNTWKSNVLEKLDLDHIESSGYSFQIELKYKAQKMGFKPFEFPIIFEDRVIGQSKMSSRILFEALYKVWVIRFR